MPILIKKFPHYKIVLYFILFLIKSSISFYYFGCGILNSIVLDNGNILLITECEELLIVNQSLSIKNRTYYCCIEEFENNNDARYNKVIIFPKEEGGYILLITKYGLHVLSKEGYLLSENDNGLSRSSYSVIPYGYEDNKLFFYNIYAEDNSIIYFNKYSYNITNNSIFNEDINSITMDYVDNNIITCQKMKYLNKNAIGCFYKTRYSSYYYINLTFFDIENNFAIIKQLSRNIDDNYSLKYSTSTIMIEEGTIKIFAFFITNNNGCFYIGYDNNTDNLIYDRIYTPNLFRRRYSLYYFFLSYFKETEEFILSFYDAVEYGSSLLEYYTLFTFLIKNLI